MARTLSTTRTSSAAMPGISPAERSHSPAGGRANASLPAAGMRCYPSISIRATACSDRGEVVIGYRADVPGVQREQRRGPARRGHKLHLEPVRLADLHDRADGAFAEPVLG